MSTVNSRLQDAAIRHALDLQRYGRGLSKELISLLNAADTELVDRLAARLADIASRGFDTGPVTTKRITELLDSLRAINAGVYSTLSAKLSEELDALAASEARFHAKALQTTLPVDLAITVPAPVLLRTLVSTSPLEGHLLSTWLADLPDKRMKLLEGVIRQGIFQGQGTDAIVRRIKGTAAARYEDGILQIGRRSAQTLVRTATSHVSNVAAQQTWKENSRVVKAWQFLATLDSRTTITCAGLSGQSFDIGEGPIPPRHPNCRSISVPVTKSFGELGLKASEHPSGTRASMDGQVSADITFTGWLKAKGDATQNEVLGATRAKLFRDGKLELKDLINGDGSVLTLDELEKRHPSASR